MDGEQVMVTSVWGGLQWGRLSVERRPELPSCGEGAQCQVELAKISIAWGRGTVSAVASGEQTRVTILSCGE